MIALVAAVALSGVALAGSPEDLAVERGWVALDAGRPLEAREDALYALTADSGSPPRFEAHVLYLRAMDAAGLGPVASGEYRWLAADDGTSAFGGPDGLGAAAVAWHWHEVEAGRESPSVVADLASREKELVPVALGALALRDGAVDVAGPMVEGVDLPGAWDVRVRVAVEHGDRKAALAAAKGLLAAHPDHPEVLAGLWDEAEVRGRLRKDREKLLDDVVAAATSSKDPVVLYRARRLAIAARDVPAARELGDALAALGEARPPLDRPPFDALMREQLARAVATQPDVDWTLFTDDEREDVVARLADGLEAAGDVDRAIAALDAVRKLGESADLARREARLLLGAQRYDDALATADLAVRLTCGPAPHDAGDVDAARLRRDLAVAHALLGGAFSGVGRRDQALLQLTIATALDPGTSWADTRAGLVGGGSDPLPPDEPIALAEKALAGGNPQEALAQATNALARIAFVHDLAPGTEMRLARAESLAAHALHALHRDGEALDAATVAAVLGGAGEDWQLRGQLLEATGDREAAFTSFSIAQGVGSPSLEDVARTYRGPGEATAAGMAAYAAWSSAPAAPTPTPSGSPAPRVGFAIPAWTLETSAGTRSSDTEKGRVVVFAFFASWCGPCMAELPEIAELAQHLRDEGVPVTMIAVSTDEREADYERVARRTDLKGLVFSWNPELAATFRVTGIPSTWVVDGQGTARFHHVGYSSGGTSRLEREIRNLLP